MAVDNALFIITVPNDDDHGDDNDVKNRELMQKDVSSSLCARLRCYFSEKSHIEPVWLPSADQKTYQVTFHAEFGVESDRILNDLNQRDIGIKNGSQVCVIPATIVMGARDHALNNDLNFGVTTIENVSNIRHTGQAISLDDSTLKGRIQKRIDTSKFKKSVRARLMVHQVVVGIRAATELSFDFVVLLSLASMLAAFGLLESSSVVIVASMLVSPLMNPIMGIVFGLSVREHSLWRRGIRNELIGLALCILWGFIIGLCTTHAETKWGSSTSFPTSEMKARGDLKRLWVGVLIALPSGAGVALSILGGNTGSLVGVAISASLLPPAVNCGLLFAYAILAHAISAVANTSTNASSTNGGNVMYFSFQNRLRPNDPIVNCSRFIDNDYLPYYSCYMPNEAAILGSCSFLLTVVNILCIIVMALVILRIKEVAPLHQASKEITNFFHHDVKVARDYNKVINENDNTYITKSGTTNIGNIVLTKSIAKRWKGRAQSSKTHSHTLPTVDQSQNKIQTTNSTDWHRLQTYVKDFDLDVFSVHDRELMTRESEEKVTCLVKNLLDMCEEEPAAYVDLHRYQPYGVQTSAQQEHISFYVRVIELLPSKWYEIFDRERCRRINKELRSKQSLTSLTSLSRQLSIHSLLNQSQRKQYGKVILARIKTNESVSSDQPPVSSAPAYLESSQHSCELDIENNSSKY